MWGQEPHLQEPPRLMGVRLEGVCLKGLDEGLEGDVKEMHTSST